MSPWAPGALGARGRRLPWAPLILVAGLGAGGLAASPAHGQVAGVAPESGQRVILVTGSTSGLGRSVALALAADGDHVIVHGRNEERGREVVEEVNGGTPGSARFYRADFGSLAEVRELAAEVLRDYDRLDVLVNNAGIALIEGPRRLSDDGYELTFQVNYLAPYLLTDLLLPLIRESAPARIVNVSSIAANDLDFDDLMLEEGYNGGRAYGQSKLAQVMHTVDLAAELEGTGVRVNALHPATFMDTDMVRGFGMEPRSTVEEGRDNVLILVNGDVGSGEYYVDGRPARARSGQPYDADARARLQEISDRLIAVAMSGTGGEGGEDAARPDVDAELDAFWAEMSRTVGAGDFEGYAALYHPDAVLVSESGGTSYPIAQALAGWKQGFDDTQAGAMEAGVEFRITQRLASDNTAHDTGIFRYWSAAPGGEPEAYRIHFEALMVKKEGRWLMVMEYQKGEATPQEWETAGER